MIIEWLRYILGKLSFFAGSVLGGGTFPKPLPPAEEAKAIAEMRAGSKEAKDRLITHNMRLVAHVVKKYSGAAETDDLISVGSIGLIKAVNTYSPERGTALATFAARCIENEILMLLRANKKFKAEVSLEGAVGTDKEGNELTLMDLLFEKDDAVLEEVHKSIEREKFLRVVKSNLTSREYEVLRMRYGLNGGRSYAQREVAKHLRISRSYISRIEKKAIEKLKERVKYGDFNC